MLNPPDFLVAAMLADPDDDAPRLAAADWFDEAERPERARLIRVQCRLASDDTLTLAATRELRAEGDALLAAHADGWLAGAGVTSVRWERGFPAMASVTAGAAIDPAMLPVLGTLYFAPDDADVAAALSVARLPNLRRLDVMSLSADAARALAAGLPRLETIAVQTWGEPWRDAFLAARARMLASRPGARPASEQEAMLREAARPDFSGHSLRLLKTWETVPDLTDPSRRARLESLSLFLQTRIGPDDLAGMDRLRTLQLACPRRPAGLADALLGLPALEELTTSGFDLPDNLLARLLRERPRLRSLGVDRELRPGWLEWALAELPPLDQLTGRLPRHRGSPVLPAGWGFVQAQRRKSGQYLYLTPTGWDSLGTACAAHLDAGTAHDLPGVGRLRVPPSLVRAVPELPPEWDDAIAAWEWHSAFPGEAVFRVTLHDAPRADADDWLAGRFRVGQRPARATLPGYVAAFAGAAVAPCAARAVRRGPLMAAAVGEMRLTSRFMWDAVLSALLEELGDEAAPC